MKETANKIGIIEKLAKVIHDECHQDYVKHELIELLAQRILQIVCGYEDTNNSNDLSIDPAFKAACERLLPESIIFDMDDTEDKTHGTQQLSLFNAYHDEYCYMPYAVLHFRWADWQADKQNTSSR